jgi:hypothetical protein
MSDAANHAAWPTRSTTEWSSLRHDSSEHTITRQQKKATLNGPKALFYSTNPSLCKSPGISLNERKR